MARASTIKAPTAAMLLLALVVAAAAVSSSTNAADQPADWMAESGSGHRNGGHHSRVDDGLPAGLRQCVNTCGTQATACLIQCLEPAAVRGDPVALRVCLLNCTNTDMICATLCSSNTVY